jgi:hypothetical protein
MIFYINIVATIEVAWNSFFVQTNSAAIVQTIEPFMDALSLEEVFRIVAASLKSRSGSVMFETGPRIVERLKSSI